VNENYELVVSQDKVHLKPFTYLTVTLLTKQSQDGTPAYLTTPKMVAEFEVTIDSLYETVN